MQQDFCCKTDYYIKLDQIEFEYNLFFTKYGNTQNYDVIITI